MNVNWLTMTPLRFVSALTVQLGISLTKHSLFILMLTARIQNRLGCITDLQPCPGLSFTLF